MKEIHIRLDELALVEPELIMGASNKEGESIGVNPLYFTHNKTPWFPTSGEFHFSRYPCQYWKEALLKMKAGGIDIVSTYVFWIHHEEIEGQFKWEGDLDLREFIRLCTEVGLKVILRIGPWNHGEVRNGGYPDRLF